MRRAGQRLGLETDGLVGRGRIQCVWGGDVVVTAGGGQPLFSRPHGLVALA